MNNLQPHEYANIFPMMTANEMRSLLDDMKANGYDKAAPIMLYEGKILDGRNRYAAASQLGIEPTFADFQGDDALRFVVRHNLNRRHLDDTQRGVIARKLETMKWGDNRYTKSRVANLPLYESPELSPETSPHVTRKEAAEMMNVSPRTVTTIAAVEKAAPELIDKMLAGELSAHAAYQQVKVTRDEAAKMAGVSAKDMSKIDHIEKVAPELMMKLESGEMTLGKAEKEVKAIEKATERAVLTKSMSESTHDDRLKLYHCGVADLKQYVLPNSIDYIITDPPYPKEFLDVYSELADFAAYALKPGGSLLVMCGQSYFPDVLNRLSSSGLNYHWLLSYLTPGGQSPQIWQRKVNTFCKPVLWFVSGEYNGQWVGDVIKSDTNDNDKEHHYWGQSVSGMANLVSRFVKPTDIICDPFLGGGTTAKVALDLNCYFIGCDIDEGSLVATKARLYEQN